MTRPKDVESFVKMSSHSQTCGVVEQDVESFSNMLSRGQDVESFLNMRSRGTRRRVILKHVESWDKTSSHYPRC